MDLISVCIVPSTKRQVGSQSQDTHKKTKSRAEQILGCQDRTLRKGWLSMNGSWWPFVIVLYHKRRIGTRGKLHSGFQSPCHHCLVLKPFHSGVADEVSGKTSMSVKFGESKGSMQPSLISTKKGPIRTKEAVKDVIWTSCPDEGWPFAVARELRLGQLVFLDC